MNKNLCVVDILDIGTCKGGNKHRNKVWMDLIKSNQAMSPDKRELCVGLLLQPLFSLCVWQVHWMMPVMKKPSSNIFFKLDFQKGSFVTMNPSEKDPSIRLSGTFFTIFFGAPVYMY